MYIKQLSVFVENKAGRLAEITSIIAKAGIDIRALSISDTTDFGILRLVVDKPQEAEKTLREAGLTVSLTNVIAVAISDKMGGFAETLSAIANEDIGVEYMYTYLSKKSGAYFIMRVLDSEKAVETLKSNGFELLSEEMLAEL